MIWQRRSRVRALAAAFLMSIAAIEIPEQAIAGGNEGPYFLNTIECGNGTVVAVLTLGDRAILRLYPKSGAAITASLPVDFVGSFVAATCGDSGAIGVTQRTAAATTPVDSTIGLFDGDDLPDVATANQGSSNVSIQLGTTDGAFTAPIEYATGASPQRIKAGLLDGDAEIDLLTANTGNGVTGNLTLLIGNGDGSFQAPAVVAAGTLPVDVDVADFDEDGQLDIVAADASFPAAVVVRLGNGDGTFQAEQRIATPVASLVVADVDGDDHADVVTNRAVLLGDGDGGFAAPVELAPGLDASVVRVGDVDGDQVLDVVVASTARHMVSALLGNGDGTFAAPASYVVGNRPVEIVIRDLDDDGRVDLLVSNVSDDHLSLLRGRGDGTFVANRLFPSVAALGIGAFAAAAADFTGDLVPDVVAANGGTAVLLPGLGGGMLGTATSLTGLAGTRVIAGDWNGDGDQDLASTSPGLLSVALGSGNGTFATPTSTVLPGGDSFPDFIATARVDAGSVPDLLVANTGAGSVSVFVGNGSGGFTARPAVPIGTFPNGIATGDFDDDGDVDLAVTNRGSFGALNGSVQLVPGNGDGTFGTPQALRSSIAADSVVAGDFDGDEALDLAYVIEGPVFDWDVEVLLGNGDGSFAAPAPLGLAEDLITGLRSVDVDQDDVVDLVVSLEGTRVAVLRGDGDGGFLDPVLFDTGGGLVLPADLDQDALPDLVTASETGLVAVLLNTSTPPDATITNGQPSYVATGARTKIKLRFTASEPDCQFECRLKKLKPVRDTGAWAACRSPYRARLGAGKFQFLVRATDPGGNVDTTPAAHTFKIKVP